MAIYMQVVYHNVLILEVYTPPRFGYGFFGTSVADLHNAFNFIICVVFPLSHTQQPRLNNRWHVYLFKILKIPKRGFEPGAAACQVEINHLSYSSSSVF